MFDLSLGDLAHLHLLLNHVPTVGAVFGVGILVLSFLRKSDQLRKASLEVFFLIALATLPLLLSGVAAQAALDDIPGVVPETIATHENAALFAFILMQATGALAWLALWQIRRSSSPARGMIAATTVLSVLTLSAMARTAYLGGAIRHPEILAAGTQGATPAGGGGWLTVASIRQYVLNHPWVWPTSEVFHFLGMSLMFGVLLVVGLRLLGGLRAMPFAAAHRLLPFGVIGLGVNLVTGMLFFIAAPEQYVENIPFHWKMFLLGLTGICYLVLTVSDRLSALPGNADASLSDRILGAATLVLMIGVMYCGRMLPFIGNAF